MAAAHRWCTPLGILVEFKVTLTCHRGAEELEVWPRSPILMCEDLTRVRKDGHVGNQESITLDLALLSLWGIDVPI
jgi:hypothetical protein